ncbi:MAG TPA: methyltransferase domain-containing protein, partial [Verrucomicrobiota bacterium]|nr:methyltransferase domain-containing protein [Verrucomicrobiota bacterium]
HLRGRAEREKLSAVRVVEGSDRSVELPEASIDVAFICDVYHHFEHPEDSLASIRRALRPGGSLVLIDFERIPGKTSDYLLQHVRAGRDVFSREILDAGFRFTDEIELEGLEGNYILRFVRE